MLALLFVMIIIALVTLLSVQNASSVVISLLFWNFEVSLAFILVISALAGVLIGAISASHFKKGPLKNQKPPIVEEKEDLL